ncbi:MAG: aldehyde dehydrogenase family protein [Candidatus Eremiobacterota bacterium]
MIDIKNTLNKLGIKEEHAGAYDGTWSAGSDRYLKSYSPVNGSLLGTIRQADINDYKRVSETAGKAFLSWRHVPAPKRGELVRQISEKLREYKEPLGTLVSIEMGKILQEGLGEVQEMIDMCDFAVGLSRQLYGLNMPSERVDHIIQEQWHPLGTVGVITAFNFPVAVWSWNAMLALICGDSVIWKPSSETPLCAIAVHNIIEEVLIKNNVPPGLLSLIIGSGSTVGEELINDRTVPLISFTGSTKTGKHVAEAVGKRLGKHILELGGNNAVIVSDKLKDLKSCLTSIIFGSIGTAGQRCTSTRRIIVHETIYDRVIHSLVDAYKNLSIGNPLEETSIVGPLVSRSAVSDMEKAIERARSLGGEVLTGGGLLPENSSGCYVYPCIIEAENHWDIVQEETFAPILYVLKYKTIEEAVEINNSVPQGLSSSIFTDSVFEERYFLSNCGSDCGIANVNAGTSGAEIGGAFGGEKDTGGGRESGSDAWKAYMRRQTNVISWSREVILAQGINFNF